MVMLPQELKCVECAFCSLKGILFSVFAKACTGAGPSKCSVQTRIQK